MACQEMGAGQMAYPADGPNLRSPAVRRSRGAGFDADLLLALSGEVTKRLGSAPELTVDPGIRVLSGTRHAHGHNFLFTCPSARSPSSASNCGKTAHFLGHRWRGAIRTPDTVPRMSHSHVALSVLRPLGDLVATWCCKSSWAWPRGRSLVQTSDLTPVFPRFFSS